MMANDAAEILFSPPSLKKGTGEVTSADILFLFIHRAIISTQRWSCASTCCELTELNETFLLESTAGSYPQLCFKHISGSITFMIRAVKISKTLVIYAKTKHDSSAYRLELR